jgi:hypothetical protein
VDLVPDPLLLRKWVALEIEPGTSVSVARNSDRYAIEAIQSDIID